MKFSIVIPTYNRADFIAQTIESILAQTFTEFEIIVVDDGSTDNTEEIVKQIKDSRVHYYKKENAERGAARNFGAKLAKGEYINFFDSDDLAYPNHLKEANDLILNKKPNIFHLAYDMKSPKGQVTQTPTTIADVNQQLIKGNLLSCNGVFIRKEIALNNAFSEIRKLSASEDYLLWLQLASQFSFHHSNVVTTTIIDHDFRSVVTTNTKSLVERKELMLKIALQDKRIKEYYNGSIKFLKSNTYSYISLHILLAGEKKQALKYLFKAIKSNFSFVFTKRFLAIIKRLL